MWLQASESVLCSRLSGEAPWVAFAPVGEGPIECDVPKLAEDPVGLLAPLCCKVGVVVSLVGGHRSVVLSIKSQVVCVVCCVFVVGVTNYMWSRLVIRRCAACSSSGSPNICGILWDCSSESHSTTYI